MMKCSVLIIVLFLLFGFSTDCYCAEQTASVIASGSRSESTGFVNHSAIGQPFGYVSGNVAGSFVNYGGFINGFEGGFAIDSDGDGLSDEEELQLGTNPNSKDTDGEGLEDKAEVEFGSNPLVQDTDGDGSNDYEEFLNGTDPNVFDITYYWSEPPSIVYGTPLPESAFEITTNVEGTVSHPFGMAKPGDILNAGNRLLTVNFTANTGGTKLLTQNIAITQKAISLSSPVESYPFGATEENVLVTSAGFVGGDSYADIDTAPTLNFSQVNFALPGTYSVSYSGAIDNNYSIADGAFEITILSDDNDPLAFLTEDLIAYFPLNGNGLDFSGNGHNGEGDFEFREDRFGRSGSAYSSNNETYFSTGPTTHPTGLVSVTYTAWFKPDNIQNESYLSQEIINSGTPIANERVGFNYWVVQKKLGYVGENNDAMASKTDVSDAWQHAALVKSGNTVYFYQNGILKDTKALSPGQNIKKTNIHIGWNGDETHHKGEHLIGLIDDARIYGKALTANQILTLFNHESDVLNSPAPNAAPTLADSFFAVDQNTNLGVTLNGLDPEDDPLSFSIVQTPQNGTLSGTAPNLVYTPNADFVGTDTFTYIANDGDLNSNVATVTITVNPVEEIFVWDPSDIVYGQDALIQVFNATSTIPASIFYFNADTKLPFVADSKLSAGEYPLEVLFMPDDLASYLPKRESATISVSKASLDVTVPSIEVEVGGPIPNLGISYSGFVWDETPESLISAPIINLGVVDFATPGVYQGSLLGGESDNYDLVVDPFTITVTQPGIQIVWDDLPELTYGDLLSDDVLNASANVPGVFVYQPGPGSLPDVGQTTIKATFVPEDLVSYLPVVTQKTLIVNKKTLEVSMADLEIEEGSPFPALTSYEISGFVGQDAEGDLDNPLVFSIQGGSPSQVGQYVISLSFAGDEHYEVNFSGANLIITEPVFVSQIQWAEIPDNSLEYGDILDDSTLGAQSEVPGLIIYTPHIGTRVGVGELTIRLTFVPDDLNNHKTEVITQTVSVAKRRLVVTMEDVSVIQGQSDVSLNRYQVTGFVEGESEADLDNPIEFEVAGGIPTQPGSYPIEMVFKGDDHYEVMFLGANLIVQSVQPELSWLVKDHTYGESIANHVLTASSNLPGAITYRIVGSDETIDANTQLGAGSHTIMATWTSVNAGVEPISEIRQVNIAKAQLLLTIQPLVVQPDAASVPPIDYIIQGFQYEETESVFTFTLIFDLGGSYKKPGEYPLTLSANWPEQPNYEVLTIPSTMTVLGEEMEVTWDLQQDQYIYGDLASRALLSAESNVEGQFLYQIKKAGGQVSGILTSGTVLPVGEHVVTMTFIPEEKPQDLVVIEKTITVSKANLVVKANGLNIIVGSPYQNQLSASYEGFVFDDAEKDLQVKPRLSVPNFVQNLAGQYEIQVSGGSDDSYDFTYVSGVLNVAENASFPDIAFVEAVVNPVNVAEGRGVTLRFQLDGIVPTNASVSVSKDGLPFGKTRVDGDSIYLDIDAAVRSDSGNYIAKLAIPQFKAIESSPLELNVIYKSLLGMGLLNYRQSNQPMLGAPIVNDDNSVVISTKDGTFYGYQTNSATGDIEPAWAYSMGQDILGNILKGEDDNYYALSDSGTLVKFKQEATSGTKVWEFDTDEQGSLSNGFTNSPTILNDEIVVFGWIDGHVYAVNRQTGDLVWKTDLGGMVFTPVAVYEDKIYTHTWNTWYCVLDSNGQILYKNPISYGLYRQQPSVDTDGTAYLGCDDKYVYAFWSSGLLKWSYECENIVSGGIVVGDHFIAFIDQEGILYYLKKSTGAVIKKSQLANTPGSTSHLTIGYDGTIVVGSKKGGLFAFTADGEVIWEYQSAPTTWASPSIGRDGKVFFGSDDGYFYAVQGHTSLGMQYPWYKQGANRLNTGGLWLATQDPDSGGGSGSGEGPDLIAGIEGGNIVINVIAHDKQRVYKVYTSDDLKSWIEVPGYRPNVNGEIKLPANRRSQFIKVE